MKYSDISKDVKAEIYRTAKARMDGRVMNGNRKKNGEPDKNLKGSETEFFMGAFTAVCFIASKIDNISYDEAMKYFDPNVMFSIMRGDSIGREAK